MKPANSNQYFSHQCNIPGKAKLPPPPSLERIYWPETSGSLFSPTVNISLAYGNAKASVYKLWQWFISRYISQPYKLSWALINTNKGLRGVSSIHWTGQKTYYDRHLMMMIMGPFEQSGESQYPGLCSSQGTGKYCYDGLKYKTIAWM